MLLGRTAVEFPSLVSPLIPAGNRLPREQFDLFQIACKESLDPLAYFDRLSTVLAPRCEDGLCNRLGGELHRSAPSCLRPDQHHFSKRFHERRPYTLRSDRRAVHLGLYPDERNPSEIQSPFLNRTDAHVERRTGSPQEQRSGRS